MVLEFSEVSCVFCFECERGSVMLWVCAYSGDKI